MMKRKWIYSLLWLAILLAGQSHPVTAQTEDYAIHVRKDFGYGWGGDIQGRFTISLVGDDTQVSLVAFLIDDKVFAEVNEAPFRAQFQTEDYGAGTHELSARVELDDGTTRLTPVIQYRFLDPDVAMKQVRTILLWLGGGTVAVMGVVALVQALIANRQKPQRHDPMVPRKYGPLGGSICPKCGRPFPRHIWGLNLLIGKLDRCENCGKWAVVKRATEEELREAEAAERKAWETDLQSAKAEPERSDKLDDTRYLDEI